MGDRDDRGGFRDRPFDQQDFSGSTFTACDFHQVRMRGCELLDVVIEGDVENVRINGVDVGPLIEAELDRRDPERVQMRPDDPDGFREAWRLVARRWDETVERARTFTPDELHTSVGGEWSFIETLRHLVFATESWVHRAILGDPSPWHPWSLPWDQMPDTEGVPRDRQVRPGLDEVLALRRQRMDDVARILDGLTQERLDGETTPVEAAGWPPPVSFPVKQCLRIVLNEEWMHRQYAERDLSLLRADG